MPEYLTITEAAAHLRVSARTVERMLRSGLLRGQRIATAHVVPRTSLMALATSLPPALRSEVIEAPLVTLEEAAEAARLESAADLRDCIDAGDVPALRIGSSLRLTRGAVERLAAACGAAAR
jgi:excisionase family DNA binding protein